MIKRVLETWRTGAVVAAVGIAALGGACASPAMPPGGPPDKAEPVVLRVTPESGAVNVRGSSVLFRFDEVVSERPGGLSSGSGPTGGLSALVLVSPGDGRERVSWRRTAIEVEPRGGFRPNTTYRITLLPGLADLRGNVLSAPTEIVFSTGPTIPAGRITGAIFDWGMGRVAPLAMVQAFRASDSTLRWVARADSMGRYVLRDLSPGPYTVRAYLDANTNRRLDDREAFDSATVVVAAEPVDTASTDFYTFVHDTIGPRIEVVEPVDSVALRVRFDRPVAVDWIPDSTRAFVLQRSDSSVVPLGAILPAAQLDSILDAERARADSVRRAADTTAARDTTARRPAPVARRDTTDSLRDASRAPQLRRPVPVQTWAVRLPVALPPGTYRFRAVEIPGLSGRRRSTEREFRIREPVRADSTAAPRPPLT